MIKQLFCIALLALISAGGAFDVNAQEMSAPHAQGVVNEEVQLFESSQVPQTETPKNIFNAEEYNSVVFTHWEHVAITDAVNYRGETRDVTDAELARDLKRRENAAEKVKPPPEEREIRLAGIVYRGKADWTIWLNEERVTPTAIPAEVMDLKVYKNFVEFKWFDEYTNQIFPIRLRPHQRFNIDTRIFLPG